MTGFVFQDTYLEKVKRLSDEELGRLVRALSIYHATGEAQEPEGREVVAYDFIKDDIDKADKAYQKKCQNMNRNNDRQEDEQQEPENRNCDQLTAIDSNCTQLHTTARNCRQNINKNKNINLYTTTNRAREEETPFGTVTVDPLIIKIQAELNGLTDTHYQLLEDFRQYLGDELVSFAIDAAVGNGVRNWAYVEAILKGYEKDGIRTVGEAKARAEKRKEERPRRDSPGKVLNAQKFSQRDYTEDELKSGSDDQLFAEIMKARQGTA